MHNNLKRIRGSRGMSQQELADKVGVWRETISDIERGKINPGTTLSLKLAKALGCKVEDIFLLEV